MDKHSKSFKQKRYIRFCLLTFVAFEADHKYEGSSKESTWRIAMHLETKSVGIHEVLKSLQGFMGKWQTRPAIWRF